MVKNYVKKTNRGGSYTEEILNKAITDIKQEVLTIHLASKKV